MMHEGAEAEGFALFPYEGVLLSSSPPAAVLSAFLAAARGHERNNYAGFAADVLAKCIFSPLLVK